MRGFEYIKKTREYLDYIEEHLQNVRRAWDNIQFKCADMDFVIDKQIRGCIEQDVLNHDLSKFSSHEFTQYRSNFKPTTLDVSKPSGFDEAWEHHKENNHHHWQTWTTQGTDYTKKINCVGMIIDWTAMGYKFGDTAQAYFESGRERMEIPEEYKVFMYEIFKRLEE